MEPFHDLDPEDGLVRVINRDVPVVFAFELGDDQPLRSAYPRLRRHFQSSNAAHLLGYARRNLDSLGFAVTQLRLPHRKGQLKLNRLRLSGLETRLPTRNSCKCVTFVLRSGP